MEKCKIGLRRCEDAQYPWEVRVENMGRLVFGLAKFQEKKHAVSYRKWYWSEIKRLDAITPTPPAQTASRT